MKLQSLKEEQAVTHSIYISSPIGTIYLEDNGEAITALSLDNSKEQSDEPKSDILKQAQTELAEYFQGTRKEFDVPIHLSGTDFQIKVWNALRQIPYGTTCSYSDIAKATGTPKACRAVGGANNKNSILILVPCHRVIGKNGDLVGFGAGLDVKRKLLAIEKWR